MSPTDSLKLQEQQRRNFESALRELELLHAVVPAEQVEASGHRREDELSKGECIRWIFGNPS
jgi:hypothetical protein